VAEDTTGRRTANGSESAAAKKKVSPDGTGARPDRSVPVRRRHPATTTQAEEHGHGNRTD
jgi:hypothetical protein